MIISNLMIILKVKSHLGEFKNNFSLPLSITLGSSHLAITDIDASISMIFVILQTIHKESVMLLPFVGWLVRDVPTSPLSTLFLAN